MNHHRFKVRRKHRQTSATENLTLLKHYIIFERGQKEASCQRITLRIILMYSLGQVQRNPLPLGLPFTHLQLSGQTSVQVYHQSWVEKRTPFHNTYSTYLVFLKMTINGRKKEAQRDPENNKKEWAQISWISLHLSAITYSKGYDPSQLTIHHKSIVSL